MLQIPALKSNKSNLIQAFQELVSHKCDTSHYLNMKYGSSLSYSTRLKWDQCKSHVCANLHCSMNMRDGSEWVDRLHVGDCSTFPFFECTVL